MKTDGTRTQQIVKKSVLNNFVFQLFYQSLLLIIPFVISPYLTRTLGDKSLGDYTYVFSIASYFVLLANLGISKHGQRIISQNLNDEVKLRKVFWSLLICHVIASLFSIIVYYAFVFIFVKDSKALFLIEGILLFGALADITWLFYGLQNFRSVAIKSAIIKVIECILIFILIKRESDVYKYAIILSCGTLAGQLILFPKAFRTIKPINISKADLLQHIKPMLLFSISVIAVTLYTTFDKTLLGLMLPKQNVAYYEYADKIIRVPVLFITAVSTVLFPKSCETAKNGCYDLQKKYLKMSLLFNCFLGSVSIFGFLTLAPEFSILYYGVDFKQSGFVMQAMCTIPLIVGLGDVIRMQYMIPNGMDVKYIISVSLNAVLNLILSSVLIPVIGIYGAVVGTLMAELFGTTFQLIVCRKYVSIADILKTLLPFLLIGFASFAPINYLNNVLPNTWQSFVIKAVVGTTLFVVISILFVANYFNEIWLLITNKARSIFTKLFLGRKN